MSNVLGRKTHMPSFGGKKLNARAMGGFEPDEDDDDASDFLDRLAGALGTDGKRLRVSLLAGVQAQMSLSADGKQVRFEATAAPGVEVKEVVLATNAPVAVQVMAADANYFVDVIEVECDGIGTNDNAVAILTVSGHQPIPERFLVGNGGCDLQWGRPLTQTTQFTVECPAAAAGKEVGMLFAARGCVPDKEQLNQHAKAYRAAAGGDEKQAFKKSREKRNQSADAHREKRKGRENARSGGGGGGSGLGARIATGAGPAGGMSRGGLRARIGVR